LYIQLNCSIRYYELQANANRYFDDVKALEIGAFRRINWPNFPGTRLVAIAVHVMLVAHFIHGKNGRSDLLHAAARTAVSHLATMSCP
jgi:hypothetical protein